MRPLVAFALLAAWGAAAVRNGPRSGEALPEAAPPRSGGPLLQGPPPRPTRTPSASAAGGSLLEQRRGRSARVLLRSGAARGAHPAAAAAPAPEAPAHGRGGREEAPCGAEDDLFRPAALGFDVSPEEATRFVKHVGGVQCLDKMMEGVAAFFDSAGLDPDESQGYKSDRFSSPVSIADPPMAKKQLRRKSQGPGCAHAVGVSSFNATTGKPAPEWLDRVLSLLVKFEQELNKTAEMTAHTGELEGSFKDGRNFNFENWVESPEACEFMRASWGFGRRSRMQMKALVSWVMEQEFGNCTLTPAMVRHAAGGSRQWVAAYQFIKQYLKPFDFIMPRVLESQSQFVAQIQAHVLSTAGKFVVSCPHSDESIKQLRFRTKLLEGKTVLEARYLGTEEKFPAIQPWGKIRKAGGIMFVGSQGRPAFNFSSDFLIAMRTDFIDVPAIHEVRAFNVAFREEEPVLVIHPSFVSGEPPDICIGATSGARLSRYVEDLMEDLDFDLKDYLEYLDKHMRLPISLADSLT